MTNDLQMNLLDDIIKIVDDNVLVSLSVSVLAQNAEKWRLLVRQISKNMGRDAFLFHFRDVLQFICDREFLLEEEPKNSLQDVFADYCPVQVLNSTEYEVFELLNMVNSLGYPENGDIKVRLLDISKGFEIGKNLT